MPTVERPTDFSHLDAKGRVRMVDVSSKQPTARMARAAGEVLLGRRLVQQLRRTGVSSKGNVLETARLAGIMGAKRTSDLIPLCHPLALDSVDVSLRLGVDKIHVEATVSTRAATGVEMEALTAVSVVALTIYDMCKAVSKGIVLGPVRLVEKSGGRSGTWKAEE